MNDSVALTLDEAAALVSSILAKAGFSEGHVRTLTWLMVSGERDG